MHPFRMSGAWDPVSGWLYETLIAARLGPLYDEFVAGVHLGPPLTGTIVDVGCGAGQVSRRLAERHPDATVIGVDLSPAMVRRASAENAEVRNLGFQVGDATDLPLGDGTASLVVSVGSIKHWPDPVAGVREMLRVTEPGGSVVVIETDRACSFARARRFASYFRPETLLTSVIGGLYFQRFVAGQAFDLDQLVGVLTRAGAVGLEARRVEDLPFVVARARSAH